MGIFETFISKICNNLTLLLLLCLFLIMGCHHEPGHPPGNGGTTTMCEDDTPGATWVVEPERAGAVWVSWFRHPMSTPQNPVIRVDVVVDSPLHTNPPQSSQDNPGHLTGDMQLMSNSFLTELSGAGVNESTINFSCGCDSVTGASVISGGAQTDFTFDGTSTTEQKQGFEFNLFNMQTWIVLHCQRGFEDHNNKPVNFPISVLTKCSRPDGSEYEIESTLTYKTFSNCSHSQL